MYHTTGSHCQMMLLAMAAIGHDPNEPQPQDDRGLPRIGGGTCQHRAMAMSRAARRPNTMPEAKEKPVWYPLPYSV